MARRPLTDAEILGQIPAARTRSAESARIEPRAVDASFDAPTGRLLIELKNGCAFAVPISAVTGLAQAMPEQLHDVAVGQDGEALVWEAFDEYVSVPGLMARVLNLREWAPRFLGQISSEAKKSASRENGKKGGRPRQADGFSGAKSAGTRRSAKVTTG